MTSRALRVCRAAFTLAAAALFACTSAKPVEQGSAAVAAMKPVAVEEANLDRSVQPCDDFYQFACGGWIAKTAIPPDQSRWVRSFSEIVKRNESRLRTLVEAAAAGQSADPETKKLGDLYATCMDEARAETTSMLTLQETLTRIDAIADNKALAREVADLRLSGTGTFFNFRSGQDYKDATQVIGVADMGGLGLPDRDMYFDEKFAPVRAGYEQHLRAQAVLMGASEQEAAASAKNVLAVEVALAKATMPRAERRKPENVYHRIDRKGLASATPRFEWDEFFAGLGVASVQTINVTSPAFFEALNLVLEKEPLDHLRQYLRAHAINGAADTLGKKFVDEKFAYEAKAFTGNKEDLPRWKRCINFVDGAMGEALGKLFVKETFGADGKAIAQEMIGNVEKAFEANLGTLSWMNETARAASAEKLHKVANKIGYPNKWRDYGSLSVGRVSYLQNSIEASRFERRRDLAKIGKPVDRNEFGMTPPTVNAYYNGSLNEMVFPAGILQIPFFDKSQAAPENYGAAGFVMGHELTHGFDDRGRKFDGDGNLREWWDEATAKAYEERAACVDKQYEAYTVEDLHLNGKLTLGENIADIGGLKLAFKAFQLHKKGKPEGEKVLGFSEDQRFFLAAAQVWCQNTRPEQARTRVKTDSHSPGRYRVNGPMIDNPDFAAAFQCSPQTKMATVDRCEVW